MTPLIKSLIGIGLAGGGTGLAVGGYYLMKNPEPTTLLEKFKKEKIEILDYKTESDNTVWTTKLEKYKAESEKFEGEGEAAIDDLQKLKDKCKEYLEKTPEEIGKTNGLEDKVKKWCAKDKPQG